MVEPPLWGLFIEATTEKCWTRQGGLHTKCMEAVVCTLYLAQVVIVGLIMIAGSILNLAMNALLDFLPIFYSIGSIAI